MLLNNSVLTVASGQTNNNSSVVRAIATLTLMIVALAAGGEIKGDKQPDAPATADARPIDAEIDAKLPIDARPPIDASPADPPFVKTVTCSATQLGPITTTEGDFTYMPNTLTVPLNGIVR